MENIRMIDIELIHQHPDNPRKDVGDVTELAESIKQQGIMQNLTVVPFVSKFNNNFKGEGMFTVIIGHRRLAAAKLAGLKEVPCVVVEMSEKEQLAIMLSENMQRVDLTPVEEALGVQMLLDLGNSIKDVSKLTGFSESKVRQRAKISQLPREALLTSKDASLQDYIKITEVEDEGKRKKLLKALGTTEFNLAYNRAISEQKSEKKKARWTEILESFAFKITSDESRNKKYVTSIYPDSADPDKYVIPSDADDVRYYYEASQWYIRLCIDYTPEEEELKKEANRENALKSRERDVRANKLKALDEEFSKLRYEFAENYTGEKAHAYDLVEFLIHFLSDGDYHYFRHSSDYCKLLGFKMSYDELCTKEEYQRILMKQPQRLLLCFIVANFEKDFETPWNYWHNFNDSNERDAYLKVLKRCGYEMAEEEKKYYEGTHEIYVAEDEDDE
jgi:ParB family chromosome partitioning protein